MKIDVLQELLSPRGEKFEKDKKKKSFITLGDAIEIALSMPSAPNEQPLSGKECVDRYLFSKRVCDADEAGDAYIKISSAEITMLIPLLAKAFHPPVSGAAIIALDDTVSEYKTQKSSKSKKLK